MELGPLAGQKIGVDGVAHERVTERQAVLILQKHGARNRLAKRVVELGTTQLTQLGQQLMVHPLAADSGQPQRLARLFGERLDPDHQSVPQSLGNHPALGRCVEELLGEERIAVGPREQVVHQRFRGPLPGDRLHQLRHLGSGERIELDALDTLSALLLGEEWTQRVTAVKLVASVSADDHQANTPRVAGQERDEIPGGAVGPVEILDQEQHGRPLR